MNKASKIFGGLLTTGMIISFAGLILCVLLQVFARLFLPKVPSWTEEVSRFLLIWMVSFGAGLSMRDTNYVNVDLFTNMLPKQARKYLSVIADVLVIFLMAVFFYWAIPHHIRLGGRQTSPALEISMQYVFAAFIVMPIGIIIFGIINLINKLTGKSNAPLAAAEAALAEAGISTEEGAK